MQRNHKLSWLEIYEYVHALKLSVEDGELTPDFICFLSKTLESVEQGLLSNFDDIIPQIGEEFNPILHEQIGYVQNSKISKVYTHGKIMDGIVIIKARVKR